MDILGQYYNIFLFGYWRGTRIIPNQVQKKLLEFLKYLLIFASAISGTKLIFEKTILIQHAKDIKGTKKTKYEYSSFKDGETYINEKKS